MNDDGPDIQPDLRPDNPVFFISGIWPDTGFDLPDSRPETGY
jgi:hypothetical protein